MDNASYEEHRLGRDATWADYITEGSGVQLMQWNGKIISVDLPNVVSLKVGKDWCGQAVPVCADAESWAADRQDRQRQVGAEQAGLP